MSKEEICFYYYFSFSLPEYQIVFVFLKLVAALCVCVCPLCREPAQPPSEVKVGLIISEAAVKMVNI